MMHPSKRKGNGFEREVALVVLSLRAFAALACVGKCGSEAMC